MSCLWKKENSSETARVTKIDHEIIRKPKLKLSHETLGNISTLNIGKRTWASGFLKSIRYAWGGC
mgnify:CR=1 FL=1